MKCFIFPTLCFYAYAIEKIKLTWPSRGRGCRWVGHPPPNIMAGETLKIRLMETHTFCKKILYIAKKFSRSHEVVFREFEKGIYLKTAMQTVFFFYLFTGHLAILSDHSVMYYNLQETPHTYPLIYIAHVCSALRLRHGQLNACVYKHSRSGSPCCITKDTRLRLLQLKIMASAVTTIYVTLLTYLERKQVHFCCITSVNGNYLIS